MNIDNLRQAIKEKNFNVSTLAKRANVGQATISEILNGIRSDIKLSTAKKIAEALDISIEKLCKEDKDDNKKKL